LFFDVNSCDTEYTWPWYGHLVGAYFDRVHGHSPVVSATVHVVDPRTPSTSMLPATWVRTDEWYNFATNPTGSVHVLLTVDEATYHGGVMGATHPIAWSHLYDGGRAWYTAMGHTAESYAEPLFLAHLWGGIVYAAGCKVGEQVRDGWIGVASYPRVAQRDAHSAEAPSQARSIL
jgi:hypothetical protein